jgi:hypothetical protein
VRAALVGLLLALLVGLAGAGPYAAEARVAGIGQALDALQTWPAARTRELADRLRAGARTECQAGYGAPPVSCVIDVATAVCAARAPDEQGSCRLVADVMVTNMLGEDELVDRARRVELMSAGDDFRGAMEAELTGRYAALAAELLLERGGAALTDPAPAIDAFCAARARTHAMAWQRCVAALVWYIGTYDSGGQP